LSNVKFTIPAISSRVLIITYCNTGGQEEQLEEKLNSAGEQNRTDVRRTTVHSLVTTFRRSKEAIRVEIVTSSNNYLKVSTTNNHDTNNHDIIILSFFITNNTPNTST
jgi:hypothetical protein